MNSFLPFSLLFLLCNTVFLSVTWILVFHSSQARSQLFLLFPGQATPARRSLLATPQLTYILSDTHGLPALEFLLALPTTPHLHGITQLPPSTTPDPLLFPFNPTFPPCILSYLNDLRWIVPRSRWLVPFNPVHDAPPAPALPGSSDPYPLDSSAFLVSARIATRTQDLTSTPSQHPSTSPLTFEHCLRPANRPHRPFDRGRRQRYSPHRNH